MLVTILDLETTGLDYESDLIIEIGAVLYCTETQSIISQVSTLMPVYENKAEEINGISVESAKHGADLGLAWELVEKFVEKSDFIVAHGAEFDSKWVNFVPKPWLCTLKDFVWPKKTKNKTLTEVALVHGVPVISAHRALTDCLLIASLFGKFSKKELARLFEVAIKRSTEKTVVVVAKVSYGDRLSAKHRGFLWDQACAPRAWSLKLRVSEFDLLKEDWNFEYEVVK